MIRQSISCDICATEKKQTNHWFVVYEQSGELRVSGWSSSRRLRAGSKHLCGQACLHKLVDEFTAKLAAAPARQTADRVELIPPPGPALPVLIDRSQRELVNPSARSHCADQSAA